MRTKAILMVHKNCFFTTNLYFNIGVTQKTSYNFKDYKASYTGGTAKTTTEIKDPATAAAPKQEKINIELKGTYIKTFDRNKPYSSNSNIHICYDPFNKRYYTFVWIWDSHTNVFPSLVTMTYDPQRYQTSTLHQITLSQYSDLEKTTLQDYSNRILNDILALQKYRFSLPSRLRNWDYLYGWVLNDYYKKKALSGGQSEEEKKKLSAQKGKLLQRLSKFPKIEAAKQEFERKPLLKKNFVEIKSDYAYSVDGSLPTLKNLYTLLKGKEAVIIEALDESRIDDLVETTIFTYLNLLFYWVKHADILIAYKETECEEIVDIEAFLYKVLSHDIFGAIELRKYPNLLKFNLLCWRIVINGWEIFARTSKRQFKWLQLILQTVGNYKLPSQDDLSLSSEYLNRDGYSYLFLLEICSFPR